jgi:trimeric autotransporter adhesin
LQGTPIKASDTSAGDDFGDAIAVSGDVMAVGAPGKNATGAAYLFRRTGASWTQDGTALRPSGLGGDDRFGNAVGLSTDTLAVGAPGDDAPTSATNNTVFFYAW